MIKGTLEFVGVFSFLLAAAFGTFVILNQEEIKRNVENRNFTIVAKTFEEQAKINAQLIEMIELVSKRCDESKKINPNMKKKLLRK